MKQAFALEVKMPIVLEEGQQEQRGTRRSVRADIVGDKAVLAGRQVIDLTTKACGLRLMKPLIHGQHLTLKMYPIGGTAFMQCDVVEVRWVEANRAGVVFLWMLLDHGRRLRQHCNNRLFLQFKD